jgi:predicted glycosyltransferase
MKVWLDILTPKQANFLGELYRRLNAKGFKTVLTTRKYREVNELLELRNVKALPIGCHGGGEVKEKLVESSKRVTALAKEIDEEKPDVAISFSSPEAARVAYGLKIPHYCISDSPHAEAVCRLTIPLSQKLFTPWIIPLYVWRKYAANIRDIVRYKALDPIVWTATSRTNPKVIDSLKLDSSKPIVVVRTPEEYAAYLNDRSPIVTDSGTEIISKLLDLTNGDQQVVVLPRYENQAERFKKRFESRVTVPEHIIDAVPLIQAASVFIGGGGTMTAEAALLGTPAISYYPAEPTFVDRFLTNYGLVERFRDSGRIAQRALSISNSRDFREFYRKKSANLVKSMEDPLKVVMKRIFN